MDQQALLILASNILEKEEIIITVGIIAIVAIAYLLYRNRQLKIEMQRLDPERCSSKIPCNCCRTTKVLFFPDTKQVCYSYIYGISSNWDFICRSEEECKRYQRVHYDQRIDSPEYNIMELYNTLSLAKKSVDVCMYKFTHPGLARLLINLHINGRAVVRVITDLQTRTQEGSQISYLSVKGIEVRGIELRGDSLEGDNLLHNKFAVIDGKTVIHGSADWTPSIAMSYETICITEQGLIVKKFADQFKDIWKKSSDLKSVVINISR